MHAGEVNVAAEGIDYFGRGHWLTNIQSRVSLGARRRMFDAWRAFARPAPGQTLLDLGSTPDRERLDSNCMIPWFHEAGLRVSLYSPEDLSNLREVFPFATLLPPQAFGAPIPAADGSYDFVSSSAVLEHVGSEEKQIAFIRESARVGRGLFLTTPNRAHWLEFHTKLPFIHWLPRPTHRSLLRALGKGLWAEESHLRLLDRDELAAYARAALGDSWEFSIQTIWALGMPSNLMLLARQRTA